MRANKTANSCILASKAGVPTAPNSPKSSCTNLAKIFAKDQRECGCPHDLLLLQDVDTGKQGGECIKNPGLHQLTCTFFAENNTMHRAEAARCMKNLS